MDERVLERAVSKAVSDRGGLCLKLAVAAQRGWADRTVLLPNGKLIFMEFKHPNGKGRESPQQKFWRTAVRKLGHEWHLVDSLQQAITIMENENESEVDALA